MPLSLKDAVRHSPEDIMLRSIFSRWTDEIDRQLAEEWMPESRVEAVSLGRDIPTGTLAFRAMMLLYTSEGWDVGVYALNHNVWLIFGRPDRNMGENEDERFDYEQMDHAHLAKAIGDWIPLPWDYYLSFKASDASKPNLSAPPPRKASAH